MEVLAGTAVAQVAGEEFVLTPEAAVWWPARRSLLIADLHVGKSATFRAAGIPVPRGTTDSDLDRLNALIGRFGARRLIVLGDLFHSERGRDHDTMQRLAEWRQGHPELRVEVVLGNHDRRTSLCSGELGFSVTDQFVEEPFVMRHEPEPSSEGYVLCGHLHPSVSLREGRMTLRLPAFVFGRAVGVLPAFSEFTGTSLVRPEEGDHVFVIGDDEVVEVA